MSVINATYSFADVTASISGPGGSGQLAEGGIANEGITIEFNERVTTQWGADGNWMHTLHAAKGGRITIRVMKNGIANALLNSIFDFDTSSSANTGQNTISITNPMTGDSWTAIGCAGTRKPTVTYGNEGAMNEWVFSCGLVDGVFGQGSPSIT